MLRLVLVQTVIDKAEVGPRALFGRAEQGGVRPFGVSLLMAGHDTHGPQLYQIDPSGSFFAWKASAIGKNMTNAKTFLEKRYSEVRPALPLQVMRQNMSNAKNLPGEALQRGGSGPAAACFAHADMQMLV